VAMKAMKIVSVKTYMMSIMENSSCLLSRRCSSKSERLFTQMKKLQTTEKKKIC
jgi:hypothetical protein